MKSFCIKHFRRFQRSGDPLKKVKREYGQGTFDRCGYLRTKVTEHGKKRGVALHRLIMERHLGRRLSKNEVIHHINEVKADNRLENLEVMTIAEHLVLHKQGKFINPNNSVTHKQCPTCKKIFLRSEFGKKRSNHDGLNTRCRPCANAACRKSRSR